MPSRVLLAEQHREALALERVAVLERRSAPCSITRFACDTASGPRLAIFPALPRAQQLRRREDLEHEPDAALAAASMMSPVKTISFARLMPTRRASRCVPPKPGMTPRFTSGWPSFALSVA